MRIETLEELAIPLRAASAAAFGFSKKSIQHYTDELLFDMPQLGCATAVILGATKATAFCVRDAVEKGHRRFLVIGGKPCNQEDAAFTKYIVPKLEKEGLPLPRKPGMTEVQYARQLLTETYGVDPDDISWFENDRSTNFGQNIKLLKDSGASAAPAIEFYTLAGGAKRVLMTARRELSDRPVISVHNAYPTGVTKYHWADHPVARAHITMENAKSLGNNPLYVRLGYALPVDLDTEMARGRALAAARPRTFSTPAP